MTPSHRLAGLLAAVLTLGVSAQASTLSSADAVTARAAAEPARTFTSDAASAGAVPDGGAVNATCDSTPPYPRREITIPVSGITTPLADVAVRIAMRHEDLGDLAVALFAPDGSYVQLFNRPGKTTDDPCGDGTSLGIPSSARDASVVFDDRSGTSLDAYAATLPDGGYVSSGSFYPTTRGGVRTSLRTFAAKVPDPNGVWKVVVIDLRQGGAGSITAATLAVTPIAKSETAACKAAVTALKQASSAVKGTKAKVRATQSALAKAKRRGTKQQVRRVQKRLAEARARKTAAAAALPAAQATYASSCV